MKDEKENVKKKEEAKIGTRKNKKQKIKRVKHKKRNNTKT